MCWVEPFAFGASALQTGETRLDLKPDRGLHGEGVDHLGGYELLVGFELPVERCEIGPGLGAVILQPCGQRQRPVDGYAGKGRLIGIVTAREPVEIAGDITRFPEPILHALKLDEARKRFVALQRIDLVRRRRETGVLRHQEASVQLVGVLIACGRSKMPSPGRGSVHRVQRINGGADANRVLDLDVKHNQAELFLRQLIVRKVCEGVGPVEVAQHIEEIAALTIGFDIGDELASHRLQRVWHVLAVEKRMWIMDDIEARTGAQTQRSTNNRAA